MKLTSDYDVIVIGGGFYGCVLAAQVSASLRCKTALVEAGSSLLGRASYANQARVHRGYHYPRSLLTGQRSQANYGRFLEEFRDAIDDGLESYYAVSRIFSNVTAAQFAGFCRRIGAPLREAPPHVTKLFNPDLVEAVFKVEEAVFHAEKLRNILVERLSVSGVDVHLQSDATRLARLPNGLLDLTLHSGGTATTMTARHVFDCTYSRLNRLLVDSGISPIALKHELAELVVLEPPEPLGRVGVTLMCGPFFSLLPFPPRGLHSLSHVRYTPHCEWQDADVKSYRDPHALFQSLKKRTHYLEMIKDASRYLPILSESRYVDSLWELKTVLPRSEVDDSRPILFKADYGMPGLHCVIGSKLDNVYDMIDFVSEVVVEGG